MLGGQRYKMQPVYQVALLGHDYIHEELVQQKVGESLEKYI